ncbi:ATP-binding protein [Verminephrobacter aporrectodeae subsp. tuberculatae]|uniref:ATP-binding protein n=1 Tax=Verminephrobacter aporrectodeae subsp. tuberculatae TaxID=1110392 RepID=A0ABT3KRM6_9BURK|nr:ATP-binding protein [Verminephrobacter aporrectodeae]MCW5220086.1 ATP-binding protein [Verminephrobacter aporrectodeae subsp. tuberculatae]MCW5289374.1 ATP-binding protein [Verminephrobacter aporrectodeae subsp. tuberculatae]MCW5320961.1 ATP-binding protein [Verminephrobacter aporrectodeae subsp. tuberculatae]
MLTSFHLRNFKSFQQDAVLPLASLTVLIGANAAGKSNVLEGLRLLSWLAQGNKLGAIQHAVNQTDQLVRGRISDIFQKDKPRFGLGCTMEGMPGASKLDMELELRAGELHIVAERMGDDSGIPLYDMDQASKGHSTEARVAYNNFSKGGKKPHIPVSDQMAVFAQLESPASFDARHKNAQRKIPQACKYYQSGLSNILFLDPIPTRMRDYSFQEDKQLGSDGANLSSVLFRLWYGGERAEIHYAMEKLNSLRNEDGSPTIPMPDLSGERQEILSFIQSLPEQDIQDISFLHGPRNDVMVQLVESFGGVPRACEAALLSDGTLRVLAIAAAMLSAPKGSLVVIEEIDNGVHPGRARHLLERIQTVAEERKLRVLLSTHNPAMLDALPDRAVPDVVFCYRDPKLGDSRLVRLGSLPDAPDLLIPDTLGHLMTSGALDRFVKNRQDPQARKEKALTWLASLKATGQ